MEHLSIFTGKYEYNPNTVKYRSERDEYINTFVTRINNDRILNKYKPLSVSFIAFKLSHLKIQDLHYLLRRCEEGKNFGATFFYLLNVDKK